MDELVSVVLQYLPLKEDFEEYKLVCKAFLTLSSPGHKLTLACLPKMLECATIFTVAHGINMASSPHPVRGHPPAAGGGRPQDHKRSKGYGFPVGVAMLIDQVSFRKNENPRD